MIISNVAITVESKINVRKIDCESYTLPNVELNFAVCHLPFSQQSDGFKLLVDSYLSINFIGSELIHGVESRMLEYTKIEPPMEIRAAGDNMLRGTAEGIVLVVVRGRYDLSITVKSPIVLVLGLNNNIFSSLGTA